ncbi:hypothetical protein [Bacillus pseudomycoides]|nr:hypothetical protein [Bacillus pseudomycoides]
MLKLKFKKSNNNIEFDFECNIDKVISAIIGTSTIVEFFKSLGM